MPGRSVFESGSLEHLAVSASPQAACRNKRAGCGERKLTFALLLSVFMISGGANLWIASFGASRQNSASSVFDIR